jgi:2-polyprenyl-3-methyl-5-hydroxy-6-metoxy-1,4-benzoquinol methylase
MTELVTPVASCPMCGSFRRLPYAEKHGGSYAMCRQCRTVYADPRPSDEMLVRRLDEFAPTVDSHDPAARGPEAVEAEAWKLELVEQLPLPGRRLLDVGCGSGAFVAAAMKAGFAAEGQDLAPAVAAAAAAEYGIVVHAGPVDALDATYDVITLWDTLEHVVDPPGMLRELSRLLVPGGWVVVLSPHCLGLSARVRRGAWWVFGPADHIVMFSGAALQQAMVRAGLRPMVVHTRQLSPPFPPEATDGTGALMSLWRWADRNPRVQRLLTRRSLGDWLYAAAGKPADQGS